MTILFDTPVRIGLARAGIRAGGPEQANRDWFESRTIPFFRRVRKSFLDIAKAEPRRVKVIDANRPIEFVQADLRGLLERKGWI
jgi:dTMP kinase